MDACDLLEVSGPLIELPHVSGAEDERHVDQPTVGAGKHDKLPAGDFLRPVLQPQVHDQEFRLRIDDRFD
jgi:hypothetical protein